MRCNGQFRPVPPLPFHPCAKHMGRMLRKVMIDGMCFFEKRFTYAVNHTGRLPCAQVMPNWRMHLNGGGGTSMFT